MGTSLSRLLSLAFLLCQLSASAHTKVQPISFQNLRIGGELKTRIERNFQRLHGDKYQPDHVFLTMEQSGDWPGDTEGRTMLGLVLESQALHKRPLYLTEIVKRIPSHLNELGYMGPVYPQYMHEQQLSGNGWMLRALCEYYLWKRDVHIKDAIDSLARHLFLPGIGQYSHYPIEEGGRTQNVGEASGSIVSTTGKWMLSTDIGCVFIGMEGLIHAFDITQDTALQPAIEELIQRFLEIDLVGIKAQTHATLTACRGLVRYALATNRQDLIEEAEKRFALYVEHGMTENYENYNWFGRFDTWTEPCAIVDSYLLATQLWQATGKSSYLEWAELIYYNAICHTQRENGGFGCDNCPGQAEKTSLLQVKIPEAHWCCTMRGAEGLANAARFSCFENGKDVWLPFYHDAEMDIILKEKGILSLQEETEYPFGNAVKLTVKKNTAGKVTLRLPLYSWMGNVKVKLNGKEIRYKKTDGFALFKRNFNTGDCIEVGMELLEQQLEPLNKHNSLPQAGKRILRGPLMLCQKGTSKELLPIYHLMSPDVLKEGYGIDIFPLP